jgi:cytochrome c2
MAASQKIDFGIRPKCQNDGCNEDCQVSGRRKDGSAIFRKVCQKCHGDKIAKKHGAKNLAEVVAKKAGFETASEYSYHMLELRAESLGFANVASYINSTHPYRKYRKSYCENIHGILGFKCTTTILLDAQLEVDHIDGDPSNNDESNLQTLCACCHKYKTIINEDYATPGRKALGVKC